MEHPLVTHDELKAYLANNLITLTQVSDLLGISKQMVSNYVKMGQLAPVFQSSQGMLFYKHDIEEILSEAEQYRDCSAIAQTIARQIRKNK